MVDFYRTLLGLLEEGTPVAVATIIESRGSTPQREGGKMIVADDGRSWFTIGGGAFEALVIDDARACLAGGRSDTRRYSLHESGEDALGMACGGTALVFIEVLRASSDLIIFGAGHVGRALARMAAPLGFRCTLVDDRPGMLEAAAFPAGSRLVLTDRDYAANIPATNPGSYVVLVTRCHDTDEASLRSLLHGRWLYLGMIGSRRKVMVVFDRLRGQGVDEAILQRVHAPIGVPIGSHLPGEVAVSIMAELVAVRNGLESPGRAR